MPPPFRSVSVDEFGALLRDFPFRRDINAIHMHHTWRPNHAQYRGQPTIVGMWRTHTSVNGWSDIAQHLTIGPDGSLWLCRNWNLPPASAGGHNGSAGSGPFMFEMVGDFDVGKDPFGGAQKDTALRVVAMVQDRFGLAGSTLRFHNQMSSKTCPGSAIDYLETLAAVEALRSAGAGTEAPLESTEGSSDVAAARGPEIDDIILSMLRDERLLPGSDDGAQPAGAGTQKAMFGGPALSIEMVEALRPHVVNLSRGRFSAGGVYQTTAEDVDAIFGEDLEHAVEGRNADNPLRIVIWAHGGLIGEEDGLLIAHKHLLWWQRNDIYPLSFVWETGLLAALGRLLTGRSGGPELTLRERLTEITDRRVEDLARIVQGPAIWADMKQSARLAIDPDDGAAAYVARKLVAFCARYGDAVELHAVGHSAGSIFHASFLPAVIDAGAPAFRTLSLLAPAIRIDRFTERLVPLVGADKPIERLALFTMNKLRERDDTCLGIYRKSLLYLIHHALEEERRTPILGLEVDLRADPAMRRLFSLGNETGGAGEVLWSVSPAGAPPRSRTRSVSHGGFDDDPATMDSVLRRILGRDDIALSYADAADAASAVADAGGGNVSFGDEGSGGESGTVCEEGYGVAFDVLDAFERAAEAAPDTLPGDDGVKTESTGPAISFGPNARSADVTAHSLAVLEDIMRAAGIDSVQVSSTSRGPADQARVMFNNLMSFGVAHQKRLYGAAGDRVIDLFARERAVGRDAAAIKAAMAQEILRIGPTKVSRHASDPRVLNVFDVAPSSVARKQQFERAVLAEPRVTKFLKPPADPGFHLEIPQPRPGGDA